MLQQNQFQVGGVDVKAPGDDHVLAPVREEKPAVFIQVTHVATSAEDLWTSLRSANAVFGEGVVMQSARGAIQVVPVGTAALQVRLYEFSTLLYQCIDVCFM